ncbi:MAG: diacylglycerol kinase family lipid kinase [Actinobacteria bacterium]|nr:diacylglycerol kinase family lipid kinase [Actinomycetota bacterium]
MKTLIFINPASAGGKAIASREEIASELDSLGVEYTIHMTASLEDLVSTAKKKLDSDFTNFVAVGGDGTLHHMVNVFAGSNKNLGIIPMGSGNDIAANLGIPYDIKKCCKIIKEHNVKKLDLGLINDSSYYLCIAGSGFDSEVNDLANNTKYPIKGPSKYTYSVYKTLLTFRSKEFTVTCNGSKRKIYGMMIVSANLPSYGGGMKITPDASASDGLLDICIIKKMSKLHFIKVFPKVFEGKHIDDPYVEIFRTGEMKLESNYNFSVFADGEYICKLPAVFKIASEKLNFLVPVSP